MDTVNDFGFKQKKYMPVFPRAIGKTTVYIEGYPCEDAEARAEEEALRRQQAEAALEKLRAQIAKSQG